MLALTLGQLISQATAWAGENTSLSTSEVSFLVNLAQDEVATRTKYKGLEALAVSSLTSGGYRVAPPTDFAYAVSAKVVVKEASTSSSSGYWSYPLTAREAGYHDSLGTVPVGIPRVYADYGGWLELFPAPSITSASEMSLHLRYQAKVPSLVSSQDTSPLDERWHPAILYKTIELIHGRLQDQANEALAQRRYLSYIASTPSDDGQRTQDRRGMAFRLLKRW